MTATPKKVCPDSNEVVLVAQSHNLKTVKSLADQFSSDRIEPMCRDLVSALPNGFSPIRLVDTQSTGCDFAGYQLGESVTDFIQFLVEFSAERLTLRAIACRNSKRVFYQDQDYTFANDRDECDERVRCWNEQSATDWMETMAVETVRAFLINDIRLQ